MTTKAIGSIVLFMVTYLLLICSAIALTILCGFLGFALVAYWFHSVSIMLAIALVSIGALILIFLVKFIFKKHVHDLSHLTEISKEEEPMLFLMIEEIVREVKTDFPKKVYLSADVNASVFYDSSFWSMFLPVRKNLQIGLGLVNSVSTIELRAILAHEFGHFSQRSMKVGSYVYNMNKVIFNMLYDNESYDSMTKKWAEKSNYLAISVGLAIKIILGIQWILQKVYHVVNLSYMSLSREMEFHADEVAANITGSRPLVTALLRLELADQSYQTVINHYQEKINDAETTLNIYPQQTYVMGFFAEKNKLAVENNLPKVTLDHLNRYNKSKLVIKDQWASHPTTEERIGQLEKLNLPTRNDNSAPATGIFKNIEKTQTALSQKLFSSVQYPSEPVIKSGEQFAETFIADQKQYSFPEIYNTYYDTKNPSVFDLTTVSIANGNTLLLNDLFGNEVINDVYEWLGLENDIHTLQQIQNGSYDVKSFDYDGQKYASTDCPELIESLQKKEAEKKQELSDNDLKIYQYFARVATGKGVILELNRLYQNFFAVDSSANERFKVYSEIAGASAFIFQNTPFEIINQKLVLLKALENDFKRKIRHLLDDAIFHDFIPTENKEIFDRYLAGDFAYFSENAYRSEELDVLLSAINSYQLVISKAYFGTKKQLLDYQATLI